MAKKVPPEWQKVAKLQNSTKIGKKGFNDMGWDASACRAGKKSPNWQKSAKMGGKKGFHGVPILILWVPTTQPLPEAGLNGHLKVPRLPAEGYYLL